MEAAGSSVDEEVKMIFLKEKAMQRLFQHLWEQFNRAAGQ